MFQSFEEKGSSAASAERVASLRARLKSHGVDGFLVPRADEYQGEYIPPSADRLRWLTGFTGSAGFAVVLMDKAAIFSDGRYTVQLAAQIDRSVFTPLNSVETTPTAYLKENAGGMTIGFDPWLHTIGEVETLRKMSAEAAITLVAMDPNPLDEIWHDRPIAPSSPLTLHPERFAGRPAREKLADIDAALEKVGADACVLADPASSAWIFNVRGDDVPHKPLALGFSVLRRGSPAMFFLDETRVGSDVRAALARIVEIVSPDRFEAELAKLSSGKAVALDPQLTARRIADIVEGAGGTVVESSDPAILPRARKNATEIEGARAGHRRDGAAMTSFLAWLDRQAPGTVDEITAAQRLEETRIRFAETDGMPLRDIAFDTISAAGPNAALPHYRVTTASNRTLADGEVYLVDSGGQYSDATTDITRTVAIGSTDPKVRERFTLVLKGMIAISTARFPVGTRGVDLDPLARIALWRAGCDFGHGTGHGIGSYLGVHEGPQSISRRGMATLDPGMIVSNEPGYYSEGAFGIRIENLLVVLPAEALPGGDRPMLGFETLTYVPIDRRLIDIELLSPDEISWFDAYHADVSRIIGPQLDADDAAWLERQTAPLMS